MQETKNIIEERRRRRGRKLLKTIGFLVVVCAISTAICLTMFFNITDIRVAGVSRYSQEEIIATSGIQLGQNLFALDRKGIAETIYKKYPYLSWAKVTFILPTTVEIVVHEAAPAFGIINSATSYTIIGENSRVVEHGEGCISEEIPRLVGVDFSGFEVGQRIHQTEIDKLLENEQNPELLVELIQAEAVLNRAKVIQTQIQESGLTDISYYDIDSELNLSLLYDNRILMELGTQLELDYKLQFATKVLNELGERFIGTVDLSSAPNNSRVYSREQDIRPLMNPAYLEGYY